MDEGLMWFDKSTKPLADKITQAAAHHRAKFGCAPTVCYCNQGQLNGEAGQEFDGVKVVGADNVLRWHYWIGVE